jgi:septal ring factor EnvC (AmiA/AmiB activator)
MNDTSGVTRSKVAAVIREEMRRAGGSDASADKNARHLIVVSWAQVAVAFVAVIIAVMGGGATVAASLNSVVVRFNNVETLLHELKGRQEAASESVVRFEERFKTMSADLEEARSAIRTLEQQMGFRRSDLATLAAYHRGVPLSSDLKLSREGSKE